MFSLIRNLFNFKRYKSFLLSFKNDVIIGLKSRRKTGICPKCGKRCSCVEQHYRRQIRDLDMCSKKCFLVFDEKKIRCKCGYRGIEKLDFVSKSSRVTSRMENFVVTLCELMSIKDVAKITKLDWKTVKEIDFYYLKSMLPDISKLNVTRIAIDEIAIMKGHKYFTIIRDYDTGIVLKIGFGRAYQDVVHALSQLNPEKLSAIKYVSMDMWDPYIKAIKEFCPNAEIVFDKFHVVKKVNEGLDKVRRLIFSNAEFSERINVKRKRFLILSRNKNLSQDKQEDLETLILNNERLYWAYLLKEQILSIFDDKISTFEQIKARLTQWMENVLSNEIEEFYDAVETIRRHFEGILNYFRYGMTNAIAEGFNTKINIIKRRAYGFVDLAYFMLKICQSSMHRLA
jgi:transposase